MTEDASLSPDASTPINSLLRFSPTPNYDPSFIESPFLKSRLKLELKSLRTSPKNAKSAKQQSTISSFSPRETPNLPKHISPRSKDSQCSDHEIMNSSPKNIILQPLRSLMNHISRAGFKSRGFSTFGGQKFHNSSTIIKANFQNTKGKYLFSLVEGNGPFGSKFAKLLKSAYPGVLELSIKVDSKPDQVYSGLATIGEQLLEIAKQYDLDIHFSGCSLISVLVSGELVYVSNIGNCSAVLAKFHKEKWLSQPLANIHDLTNNEEKNRISEFGGRLFYEHLNADSNLRTEKFSIGQTKGIVFETTRAIGNLAGKIVGISNKPEVFKFEIKHEDKFVIIANASFWRVISFELAIELAAEGWALKKTEVCCEALVTEAESRLSVIGDPRSEVTVIVFFINA